MTSQGFFTWLTRIYLVLFFVYLFLPLIFMVTAAFNDSRFPTMLPWEGFTTKWFYGFDARDRAVGLFQDARMGRAILNSVIIGMGVIALAVPLGLAGALLLSNLQSRAKGFFYGVMVSPILTPGVILGISTLVFWTEYFQVSGGLFLAVIAQSTFIAAYCMLLFLARLERFDQTQQEAALDLGASHFMVVRRILLPYMRPAILSACLIAFLQSFENYNTTLFVIGIQDTMTINIATRVRLGLTPAVNAIGVILIVMTVCGAVAYEILRRREQPVRI
ncbi:ABC transporter permease [Desulfonatronum thioautotrophicum]|uniref:ABC transporter permease n=1 Tax=Desulfonatronum thioautotrophicum TaxID=617001 RepID=UPI0005EB2F05|nr:ABC transporter permease [Desulfonatronum thioautotrophicum]